MDIRTLEKLLEAYRDGSIDKSEIIERLKNLPFEGIDIATLDHHREIRTGFPEVVFALGKSEENLNKIIEKRLEKGGLVYVTRIEDKIAERLMKRYPDGNYYREANAVTFNEDKIREPVGKVLVITAGTSDIPVAEEAALTARLMGSNVEKIYDVGVAGIHRLFGNADKFEGANVIVVVAGMEGALPSVVGGLVAVPVVAVPTSVGYGASFGGITALLGMLNSCANGVVVVNIDNGFGAGYSAALINRMCVE
jgi:NCAIR mutase (PurE)-related protein